MATVMTNIIPRKHAENAQTTQYTSTGAKTEITKFTGTNTGASPCIVDVHLVANGGLPTSANQVVKQHEIQPNEVYLFPELVGQTLEPSGFISTLCDTNGVLVLSSSGLVMK